MKVEFKLSANIPGSELDSYIKMDREFRIWLSNKEHLLNGDSQFCDFSDLKSDEENIKRALQYLIRCKTSLNINQENSLKSSKKAIEFIEEGNKYFKQNKSWKNSLKLYTQGVIHAHPNSYDLARAYANRSAVLFNGGLYNDSIMDIERALKIGYPDNLKTKLYVRRANCYLALNKKICPQAKRDFANARKWLEKMNDTDKKYMIEILNKKFDKHSLKIEPFKKFDYNQFVPQTPKNNREIMRVSNAINVKYSKEFGLHVVATRNIAAGECLLVHKAYASIIGPKYHDEYCWNCSKRVWAGVPCIQCSTVIYCNEDCRNEAWQEHHDIECLVIPAILRSEMGGISLIALRLTVKAYKEAGTFEKLKEKINEINRTQDPIAKCCTGGIFDDTKYASVYSLSSDTPFQFLHTLKASIILLFLGKITQIFGSKIDNFEDLLNEKWAIFIGGLFIKHLDICSVNVTEINIRNDNELPVVRGWALCPFVELMNHSCDPMVYTYVSGNTNSMIALQKIEKDEQIFVCYQQEFWEAPTFIRRELLERYGFMCECKPCTEDWGPYSSTFLFPSHEIQKWPSNIVKRLAHIRKKYPTQSSMLFADLTDKSIIISTTLDMINVHQRLFKYPTQQSIILKKFVLDLYASVSF